ncbi:MAG: nucleoside phosphorylase [Bacteroidales bacterium]|nr:nucleoside phosphorylase [Bacteroidales bacterium]
MNRRIEESELILRPDGSIYHLNLQAEELAQTVILVGDPDRVPEVSSLFDTIEIKKQNREIVVHTGTVNSKRITVLSTGMGTDNIDIIINELDALVNIDLRTRMVKEKHTSLNLIRLGTSGSLQKEIPVDSFVVSEYAIGLDGLAYFYKQHNQVIDQEYTNAFINQLQWPASLPRPYVMKASESLLQKIGFDFIHGTTATAPGFYGPQGRELRLQTAHPELNQKLQDFSYQGKVIANFEMESSAIYALGQMLGHHTMTVCAIIANRVDLSFSKDYKKKVNELIQILLERISVL